MTRIFKYLFTGLVLIFTGAVLFTSQASFFSFQQPETEEIDSSEIDTLANVKAEGPQFKLKQDPNYPEGDMKEAEGVQLKQPSNLKSDVEYDPETGQYIFTNKIGNINYRQPSYMSREEYKQYELKRTVREYWKAQANGGKSSSRGFKPAFSVGSEAFQKVFGGSTISIVPQGQAELIFGGNINTTNNPQIYENLKTVWSFNFEEKIQMNVNGSIGERVKLGITYNTDATFEFENKTKLEYVGDEDDIVKKVEAGDVTLPLPGTLITGSQSLFGIKTEMQFGKLNMTTVVSQQRGQTQVIQVQGGAQVTEFEIAADEYEANKNFFLTHTFRGNFDRAHQFLPRITSPYTITRIEVWVTNRNKSKTEDIRSIYAFTDLGEIIDSILSNPAVVNVNPGYTFPSNESNNLYDLVKDLVRAQNDNSLKTDIHLNDGIDYDKIKSARMLKSNEFSFDRSLGYISLNTSLNNDEVLGVAFEYMVNGKTYKVGDLSTDITSSKKPLILKLLKGTSLSPRNKNWDLMMKNIYSLNAYEVSSEEFYLNVLFHDDTKGTDITYIPESTGRINETQILSMMNLDKVNTQLQDNPDGVFDFVDGVTIDKKYGRIIFPVLEPFGSYIDKTLGNKGLPAMSRGKYIYQELYDSTKTKAQLVAEKNKYKLKGTFKSSSSSEIYLNAMNVPQGSVKVTSGGMPLVENQDYVVDYALGSVKIVNSAVMSSGQPIKVSLENNSLFNIQTKTLVGTHLDYKISDDFNVGATIMNLTERPLTSKVNIGDEPISNTIWGLNSTYRTNSQFLTTLVDKLPLLQTKETSTITLTGEFAQLIPGSSSAIGKNGVAFIDDFEGSETKYDLKQYYGWVLASTPEAIPDGRLFNDLDYGQNRAKLSWYTIDQSFYSNNSYTPAAVKSHPEWKEAIESRQFREKDLFPEKEPVNGLPTYIYTLNLTYNPTLRGPYNFDINLDRKGNLNNPASRWGGIMRSLQTNDFEAANIEYIEFWMLDPFYKDSTNNPGGRMVFNLGDISEDILKDGKMAFEHGLSAPGDSTPIANSVWGRVADTDPITQSFTNGSGMRDYQDIGLDGLNRDQEKEKFSSYLNEVSTRVDPDVYNNVFDTDPAADNFRYFRDESFSDDDDIIARYRDYNGTDGNSPEAGASEAAKSNYSTPDMEDINSDNTLSDKENYYEYNIDLGPGMKVGDKYIVDERIPKGGNIRFLQFKIPVQNYDNRIGDIEDFKSIRFLRMYLTGFERTTNFRFATFDLVRGEWRKYLGTLLEGGESLTDQPTVSGFDIQAINVEENGDKYRMPPNVDRVIDPNQSQIRQLNEQSMVLKITDLADGDARAAFKTAKIDVRQYKKLQMEVHCEKLDIDQLKSRDVTVFIRLGSDYKGNYYEYEVPMVVSPSNTKDVYEMWPDSNRFVINLDIFQQIKQARNDEGVSMQSVYSKPDGKNRVSVCGNPSLSDIRTIMIGVRNPGDRMGGNDGLPKSAEIWVNELRLTDFSDKGGWAANSRAQVKLADFGNVRVSGATMQPGFGSIEKKVNDREKVQTNQFDVSTDLEMGKFFPEKAQVMIPVYASYSLTEIKPQYNPLDPDIPLQAAIDNASSKAEADKIEKRSIDHTVRRSINFTNVKVNKSSKKPQLYDPANFSVSYGYNDQKSRNYTTAFNNLYHHEGSFNYIFNNRPKNVVPFQKVKFLNNKALRIIKDFNFYYAPSSFSFRTNMLHDYREKGLINLSNYIDTLPRMVEKSFIWNRLYNLKFDLARSLKVDYSASNVARIDEWDGTMRRNQRLVKKHENGEYDVWKQIKNGGHNTNYNQQLNVNYSVPINKLPLLDWVTMSTRYSGNYEWQLQPALIREDSTLLDLGNNINNSRTIQVNSNISLTSIYNKVDFLKDLQSTQRGRGGKQQQKQQKDMKTVKFEKTYFSLKAGVPKSISHKLGSEDVTIKVTDDKGKEVKGKMEVSSINRLTFTPETDVTNAVVVVEGKVEAGTNIWLFLGRNTVRILTGVKTISGSYTQTEGTALPGYMRGTKFIGMSGDAPGLPFVFGDQSEYLIRNMTKKGWLYAVGSDTTSLSGNLVRTKTKTLTLRLNYEPFTGLRVDLTANHSKTENGNYAYMSELEPNTYYHFDHFADPVQTGNFSMSVMAIGSMEAIDTSTYKNSRIFNEFKSNRGTIQYRQEDIYYRDPIYARDMDTASRSGLSETSQQVLIPAFLATYAGYGASSAPLELFPKMGYMRPNWRVNFDGLSNVPYIKDYCQSVNLTHAYSATYSVGSYMSNSNFDKENIARDDTGNYVPEFAVSSVSMNEQFSPMFGIDVTLKNNLTLRFEYKKSRMIMFQISGLSISETHSKEYVIGAGYRFPDIPLTMITFGAIASPVKSDLNLRADLSIRDDINILRRLVAYDNRVTQGNRNVKLSFSADYQLSDRLTVRAFFDRMLTSPHISTSYETINSDFGFSIRFTLAQ